MEIKEIKRIVELMKSNDLTEFSLKDNEIELSMKRGSGDAQIVYAAPALASAAPAAAAAAPAVAPAAAVSEEDGLVEIPSPIVGTFYRKPAPDADAFVSVGSEVSEETVVCIIEAMKVMNEIKAETSGRILEILVENGEPVEFGQPLFLLAER
jgi:acetyl-CoA carboxylase biotin carboxyl carrier protein